jgi:O-antigen/teichoic acid export membrane protein
MIKDVGFTLATRGVVIVAGIATSVITARTLSVDGRGEYFYVVTLAGMATQFGNLGLGAGNTYALARDGSQLGRLSGNSFWLSLVIGVAAAGAVVGIDGVWAPEGWSGGRRLIALLLVPTMMYSLLAGNLLIGLSRIRDYNYFQLGSTLFQVLVIGLGGWLAWGVKGFLFTSVVAGLVASAGLMWLLSRLGGLSWGFDRGLFRENLSFSGRAYLATLFGYGVSRLGVFLLGRWSTVDEIGIYSIAVQFFDVLVILPATVSLILFPDLVRDDPQNRFSRALKSTAVVGGIMAFACFIVGWGARWVIPVFFGAEFAPSVVVVWWMLPGVLALSVTNVMSQYLAAEGIPIENIVVWAVGFVFLLVVGGQLVPAHGAVGAAIALSLTYPLVMIALVSLSFRMHRASR